MMLLIMDFTKKLKDILIFGSSVAISNIILGLFWLYLASIVTKTEYGEFMGTKETFITYEGLRLELYRGILADLRERYFIPPADQKTRRQKGLVSIFPNEEYTNLFKENSFNIEIDESINHTIVRSNCRDGSIFQLSISQ